MSNITDEHVSYVGRYGGTCRDCADENGVCPSSGLPCAESKKANGYVLRALDYGVTHGYIANPFAATPQQPAQALTEMQIDKLLNDLDDAALNFGDDLPGLALNSRGIERSRKIVRAALATVAPEAPVLSEERERAAFEAWMELQGYGEKPRIGSDDSPCAGEYANQYWHRSWLAWQARALLSTNPKSEPAALTDDERIMLEVGRQMVALTTTVRGSDEWLAIPELWRMCMVDRDEALAKLAQQPAASDRDALDSERLDYLDAINARKNGQNGTRYGWKLSENHNRIALEDHGYPVRTVREAIDLFKAAEEERAAMSAAAKEAK